jgi:hypothetical protein
MNGLDVNRFAACQHNMYIWYIVHVHENDPLSVFIHNDVCAFTTYHLYNVHVHENDPLSVFIHNDVCAFTTYHLYFLMVQSIVGLCLYNKSAKCTSYVMARESHSYGLECSDDTVLCVRPYLIP